jgi:hypothetical protein
VARTHGLKTHIQAELAAGFLARHNAVEIASGRLLGMDVDLVAYSASDRVLWACEMTTSGFLGKGGGNFHVGASRKFCEGYAKFSILLLKEQAAKEQIRTITGDDSISGANVQCRFVVPAGSRFIQALGWRQQLIGTVMQVEEVALLEGSQEAMIEILLVARRERQKLAIAD